MGRPRKAKTLRNKAGSIRRREYERNDGTIGVIYEGRYTVSYEGAKRIQKSVTGQTFDEAREKLDELIKQVAQKKYVPVSNITVEEWFEDWVENFNGARASSKQLYRNNFRRYVKPYIGSITLRKLTPEYVQRKWINLLKDPKYAIKKTLDPETIEDVHSMMRTCFEKAVKLKKMTENPCRDTELPKKKGKNSGYTPTLNEEDIKKLLHVMQNTAHERFYKFSMFFGLREMENIGLVMDDIDMEHKVLHLRYQRRKDLTEKIEEGETLNFKFLKNSAMRDIYFDDEIAKLLREQIAEEKAKKKRLGKAWPTEDLERGDLLFSNQDGNYISYRTIYDCFKRRVKKIGVPNATVHDLRHVFVMLALKSGQTPYEVAQHIGHVDPKFTLEVYAYVSKEMKQNSAANMGKLMKDVITESKDDKYSLETGTTSK